MIRLGAMLALVGLAACSTADIPEDSGVFEPVALQRAMDTQAEATSFRETSSYEDVLGFLAVMDGLSDDLYTTSFGTSVEGRDLPLVIWSDRDTTVQAVRASSKTRVLVFANIHAGEVAGKEALQMLIRDLANGQHAEWADSLVVMIAPIYNADGNERMAYDNRPYQLGPVGGMGTRANADGLDLNRDFMKLASPEARALVGLIREADPHVVVDLHTTNGTHMGYHLTYAPPLSPNTPDRIDRDLRDVWLPAISDAILASDDMATWHYGNVPGAFGEEASAPRGWYSFSPQPRFSTNYVGLRGRYGLLSEAYSYATFEDRVRVSKRFTEEVLNQAWRHASAVRAAAAEADAASVVGEDIALRATWDALPEPVTVLLGAVDTVAHPVTGDPMLRRRDIRTPETMLAFVRFAASESTVAPEAYVVHYGPHQERVRDLLDAHGIAYRTEAVWGVARQRFRVDSLRVAERPSQGVRMQEAFGAWVDVPSESGPMPRLAPALVVPVAQPLGRLVVALLEPRSDDGVVAWAILGPEALPKDDFAAIERIPAP